MHHYDISKMNMTQPYRRDIIYPDGDDREREKAVNMIFFLQAGEEVVGYM